MEVRSTAPLSLTESEFAQFGECMRIWPILQFLALLSAERIWGVNYIFRSQSVG